jgi:VCBS repeat-containing protein
LRQPKGPLPAGAATRSLAVGDVDGDGHPDLVVGNGSPDVVDVFHGNGRGAFTQSGTATVGTEADSLALADVNGDGILDLVAGNYQNSTISVALGNGDGTFVAAGPAMAVGALPVSLALGSLDTAQTTAEDTALVFGAAHGNAIIIGDGDGDTQTVTLRVGHGTLTLGDDTHVTISQGGEGQASLSISGTLAEVNEALDGLTYTPDANFNGSGADADKLTVTSDDRFEATSLSATITVTPVADAPTMSGPAGFSASWQHALDLTGQGLAVGDVDGSGDAETVTLTVGEGALAASAGNSGATVSGGGASLTISGTVAEIDALLGGAGTGTLTYLDDSATPAASTTLAVHVAGGDGFDGDGSFAIAIGVPTATAESYTLDEDTALTVPAASGVLANDHGPNGDALQAALLSGPAHGSVSLAADGSFVYTPDANFNGADSFVYQATDGAAASTPTTVGLTIAPVEDAPTAANDSAAVTEFHAVTGNVVTGAAGGSGGDSDVDGDSLAVIAVALAAGTAGHVGVALAGNYGTLTLAPDGSYSYLADPKAPVDAGTTVDDRFTYTVSDGHGGTATAELTIAVTGAASGTDGNDTISGGGGSDLLHGNPGDDTVSGGDSNDDIRGGSGNDTLLGNHGSDVLYGGAGDDVLLGRTGNDLLRGGSGNDHLNGGSGNDQLFGGAGDDHLTGMWGDDTMAGGAGNDRLVGDLGNDILTGGQGDDDLFGGAGRDTLSGGAGRDHLYGNAGNDTLLGGGDNDVLDGGLGRDTLTGGGGRDTFVFDTALRAHTPDTITDFVPWADRIELAHTVFSALPLARHLAATEFSGDGQAHTADQHILYDSHDGWLVYDANGSAPGGGTHFATLAHDLHITAADFLVVA